MFVKFSDGIGGGTSKDKLLYYRGSLNSADSKSVPFEKPLDLVVLEFWKYVITFFNSDCYNIVARALKFGIHS